VDGALDSLLESLGVPAQPTGAVTIDGADPVLATRFLAGKAAATALAATGVAASDLWQLRGGQRQRVRVDVRAAAASLVSFLLCRVLDRQPPGYGAAGIRDVFPTRDGWFFLHGSFPDTQKAALELLGCSADRVEVARAIAGWDAQELEDAIAERGLCGARVRTEREWWDHPQGRALAAHPPVEVIRLGDSPPEPLAEGGTQPLSGIRALDLTRVLAGPTCGRTLAQHGAEVLRIASPHLPSVPHFVMDTSHGKRSAHLDLDRPDEAKRLRELVLGADVFSQGYRSGALDRRGFGPEELCSLRPGLVYVSINCYGHVGPWAARPGWEQLAQTVTGISAEQGGEVPELIPAAPTDYTTGYLAALGTLVALGRRAREGGSFWVRASLCRTGMWLQSLGRAHDIGAGPDREWIAPCLTVSDTPFGRVEHLAPAVELSETPAHWARPTVPLGTHPAEWDAVS
jgi:crotonobetainyl-CoA:carnitine CoA-transferase CaiB-like acyl-CoA transferase